MVVRVGGQRGVSSVVDETTSPSQQLQEDLAKSQGQPTVSGELEKIIEQSNQPQATAEIDTSELEIEPAQEPIQGPVQTLESRMGIQQPSLRMQVEEQAEIDPEFLGAIDADDRNLYERGMFNVQEDLENLDTRRYNFKGGRRRAAVSSDGGLFERAEAFAETLIDPEAPLTTGSLMHNKPEQLGQINTYTLANIVDSIGGTITDQNTGKKLINPEFLRLSSLVTEDIIADQALSESRLEEQRQAEATDSSLTTSPTAMTVQGAPLSITKMQRNAELGDRILKEWSKISGVDNSNVSTDTKKILGDVMKELYYEVNKGTPEAAFLARQDRSDNQVEFRVTNLGQAMLQESQKIRKLYFPKEHVDALPAPRSSGDIDVSGARKRINILDHDEIRDAIRTLDSIPHWVIPRRERILLATLLPALANRNASPEIIQMAKDINGFGSKKVAAFNAKRKIKELEGDTTFDVTENLELLKRSIAQSLLGIAKHRDAPVYLTHFVQAFNGRITPEQTHFNPVSSKQIRFVTGNPQPAVLIPGKRSKLDRNLREMYSMMILKINGISAGSVLTEERLRMFDEGYDNLVKYGKKLKEALDNTSIDPDAISQAILKGMPLDHPEFPQFQGLNIDPSETRLIKAISDKGDDGLALIDGLIDLYEYDQVKKENAERMKRGEPLKTFRTHYNAYIDGKTNGLATNGLQLGLESTALRTGVLRKPGSIFAVDEDQDLRDVLAAKLEQSLQNSTIFRDTLYATYGGLDNATSFHNIVHALFQTRELNKGTTMTFGYGKELDSFKTDLRNYLVLNREQAIQKGSPLAAHYDVIEQSYIPSKDAPNYVDGIVRDIHEMYIDKLIDVVTPDGIEARKTMYNMAMFHVLMDEVFELETPTGMPIYLGGLEPEEGTLRSLLQYNVVTDVDAEGKKTTRKLKAMTKKFRPTAAAVRGEGDKGYIGGAALGGSNPAPVQSVDAATVARTFSGKSWNKIRSATPNAKGYGLQIYDAFKTDVFTHDTIYTEVNQNWLQTNKDYFYLDMANKKMNEAIARFENKVKSNPNGLISIGPESGHRKVGDLVTVVVREYKDKNGKTKYFNTYPVLENFLRRNVERTIVINGKTITRSNDEITEQAREMVGEMISNLAKRKIYINQLFNTKTMTNKELAGFMSALSETIGFKEGRKRFIEKIRKQRNGHFANIDRQQESGNWIAQYHDH